ncbi:hypothetical protein GGI19_005342 [Coemansia pectinata]|uniref:B-block binding subunit of TFIIIC domain-containing protein n=1 Tax=Coemansia pectinata TaxID=1052879 RepID=A0A9W8L9N8_9FUNG|nr:hypothetical protein GGI19_005342 [Coemansia pectinata]
MDDIIQTVKQEVALDCEKGSTLSKVWSYVEVAQRRLLQRNGMDYESVTVNDALKRDLWPFILKLPEMTFINQGTVIYEATSGGAAQIDAANNLLALSASEVESRFPDLIMCASERAIHKELFGCEEGNKKVLNSPNAYMIIQELSRSRERGMTQMELTKTLKLNPKSMTSFLDRIVGAGLATRCHAGGSSHYIKRCVLNRFTSDRQSTMDRSSAHSSGNSNESASIPDDLRRLTSDFLMAKGSEYMLEDDVMHALKLDIWSKHHRRCFHWVLGDLAKGGFVERVEIQVPDADLSGYKLHTNKPPAEPIDVDEGCDNAESVTSVPDESDDNDDESDVGEVNSEDPEPKAPESTSAEKTRGMGPVKRNQTRKEKQGKRLEKDQSARGLLDGHSHRRCVRFIKPYGEKGSVKTQPGALMPEEKIVLTDMAALKSFSDICAEAKERSAAVRTVICEYVVLGLLKQKSVLACNSVQAARCAQMIMSYATANRDSPAWTTKNPNLPHMLLRPSMDRRPFQRIPPTKPKEPTKLQIAISRDTDPDRPVVKTFIAQLHDPLKLHKQITVTAPRRLPGITPVVRTAGAKERDQDFLVRTMDTDESRARGVKNISKKSALGRKYVDSNSSKRPLGLNGRVITRGPKASRVDFMANDTPIEDWDPIDKRLQHIPLGIGRAKNLYDYLATNLVDNVDDAYLYENYTFWSTFLFDRLPLELFLQITGGIAYFPGLLLFIRYGICTRVDARTRESVEAQIIDAQNSEASSLESINERLMTPVNKLPKVASEVIDDRCGHVSQHIRSLINKLIFLQLLHPVYTVKGIVSMPPPPDAKDAFSSIPVTSLKNWATGYQLIGKARILDKKGYDLALDAYNDEVEYRLDLTTCYLGSNVYDMMDKDSSFSYWSDLQMTAEMLAKHLRPGHILFGIGLAHHWLQNVSLDVCGLRILHTYVYESNNFTPLDYPKLLADAAKRARTTLEKTRRVFQHQHADMSKRSYRGLTYQVNRKKYGDKTIKRVKTGDASGNENSDTDSGANGGASSHTHGGADSNASGDSVDALATEYTSYLEDGDGKNDMDVIYISSDSDDGLATSSAIDLTDSDFE